MSIFKKASALLAAGLSAAVLLTGCGGDKGGKTADKIIGTWECEKISMSGMELDPATFSEQMGIEFEMNLEVTKDKISIEVTGEEPEETEYELNGNVLLDEDGSKLYYDEDSKKLIMEGDALGDDSKVTFVKK